MAASSREFIIVKHKIGKVESGESHVIVEKPVSLTVNGDFWVTLMCTPVDLDALAVGFLYNEGFISSMDDVASVRVCPTQDNVDVWLNASVEKPTQWRQTTGCTGGVTSVSLEDESSYPKDGITLSAETLTRLIDQLLSAQSLYKETGGVHTSALSDGESILVAADDIGRHNSLDKIAGLCLLQDINPPRRVLLTTGRISSEMLQKAVRIGASILISRTSPSSLAVEMAQKRGLTLVGYARRDRFNIYTYPGRILFTSKEDNHEFVNHFDDQEVDNLHKRM